MTNDLGKSRNCPPFSFMKLLTIDPFNYPEDSDNYRGTQSNVTGDPKTYTQSAGVFLDDLIAALRFAKINGLKIKPVELNFEIE